MLTIFTCPKAFTGDIDIIQRNAVQSWKTVHPDAQVILCGDDAGIAEVAAQYGVEHIPEVECNSCGTPLLSSAFKMAAARAKHDRLCYTNADILLAPDAARAVSRIPFRCFLTVTKRRDVEVAGLIPFDDTWPASMAKTDDGEWLRREQTGVDVFIFTKDRLFTEIPPFAVGRPAWDHWYVYNVWKNGVPIVDVSDRMTVVHQKHDYAHVGGSRNASWSGPEGDRNRELAGGWDVMFTVLDASHVLGADGPQPARRIEYTERRVDRLAQFRPRLFRALLSWRLRYLFCKTFTRI